METALLYIFIYCIEAFIFWWYASNLFESRFSKSKEISTILLLYIFLFIFSFYKSFLLNAILFTLVNCILLLVIYNVHWKWYIFHSMIMTCIMSFSEIAIMGLSSQFTSTILITNSEITSLIMLTMLSKFLYYFGLRITLFFVQKKDYQPRYYNRATALLNIVPFISFYIIIALCSVLLNTTIANPFRYLLSSCSTMLLIMNILIFYIYHYTQQKNKEYTDLHLQLQKEEDMFQYYKSLFEQDENQQIMIHDIRNHLLAISKLSAKKDFGKIDKYLQTLLDSSDLQNSVQVSDNESLNSLLCHYINICNNNNITFKIDIRKKLLANLEYSDLTSLFCNLLDNATEACINIPDSYIELNITAKTNAHITLISMINTCRTHPSFKKNGIPLSSKENKRKHGFGIKSINRVVEKYNGNLKMYYDDDKQLFHTIITLKC